MHILSGNQYIIIFGLKASGRRSMKKLISIMLILIMLVSMSSSVFADSKGASLSTQKLIVDGKPVTCEIYNIFNNNYFKLRDLAYVLNGSGSSFSVSWDPEAASVNIKKGGSYKTVGGELELRGDLSSKAAKTAQGLIVDGEKITNLSVYNIGGNNFFKLRDLGSVIGFDVDYDSAHNSAVVTSKSGKKAFIAASYAESCGLPKAVSKIAYPKTESDYTINFLYEMLHGNYTPTVIGSGEAQNFAPLLLSSLCGALANQGDFLKLSSGNGKWSLSAGKNILFTNDEIFRRNSEAYKAAVDIATDMWNNEQITADMSDLQKAQSCYNKFRTLGVTIAARQADDFYSIQYDDAYAALISKNCSYLGHSAGFVMLLRVVGIKALSLPCRIIKSGSETELAGTHSMQYLLLDGEEYFSDIYFGYGIGRPEYMYNNGRQYEADKLAIARRVIKGDFSNLMTGAAYKLNPAGNGKFAVTLEGVDILPSRAAEIIKETSGGQIFIKDQKYGFPYGTGKEDSSYLSIDNRRLLFSAAEFIKSKSSIKIDDIISITIKLPDLTIKALR